MIRKGFVNALIRGILSLWVLGAGFSARSLEALSANLLPLPVVIVGGILANVCIIPTIWVLLLGVIGLPNVWLDVLNSFFKLGKGNFVEKLVYLAGQIFQILVFRPFQCPPSLQSLPTILKTFLFRDPERLISPPESQTRQALVKDELWIYVNGVATTTDLAKANADFLHQLFGRPVWTCYNPTDGVLIDLLECIVDKIGFLDWFWETKPRAVLSRVLQKALLEAEQGKYSRIVLVAHSQGTIITSTALREIVQGDRRIKELSRRFLEVFAFADCAHQMVVNDRGVQVVNFLENISNGLDTVAWLGVLFPFKSFWKDKKGKGIEIEGSMVTEPKLWGHFLNTHYLEPFSHGAYRFSRLHSYRNGGKPAGAIEFGSKQRITAN
eukprot:scaffold1953_cov176-Amphora_coffeaeformis.AAC.26